MCGIVGYIGNRRAQPILIESLGRLEYRGYDSCGIAVCGRSIKVYKDAVTINELSKTLPHLDEKVGIGHTRWATHGEPSKTNAHPHLDCSGKIAVVHNGIIVNHEALKTELIVEGHRFISGTDTEVIPHLIEKYYQGNLEEALEKALSRLEGSYAIAVMVEGEKMLAVARKDSPLVIGIGDGENFAASDVPAILGYTRKALYLDDGEIALLTPGEVRVKKYGKEVRKTEARISWSIEDAEKAGYEHFMLKEIHEAPKVVRDTIGEYAYEQGAIAEIAKLCGVVGGSPLLVACGTSYYAALVGQYLFEEIAGVPARACPAGEFNYSHTPVSDGVIAITQSGETADTIKAMHKVKEAGAPVVVITNVVGSSASRIADRVIYTHAGPEISVAATKTFIAQLVALYFLTLSSARIGTRNLERLLRELKLLPGKLEQVLNTEEEIKEYAKYLTKYDDIFFIARGINYPIALEGALKIKEIAYIHAEGYSAGELKHGAFALLGSDTPVVAILSQDNTYEAMLSNIKEIKARKAPIIALTWEDDSVSPSLADMVIRRPEVNPLFSPVVSAVVLQLLAYYTAKERGLPIDRPRNLAKSVTVE